LSASTAGRRWIGNRTPPVWRPAWFGRQMVRRGAHLRKMLPQTPSGLTISGLAGCRRRLMVKSCAKQSRDRPLLRIC
jgi:hypothetical protein